MLLTINKGDWIIIYGLVNQMSKNWISAGSGDECLVDITYRTTGETQYQQALGKCECARHSEDRDSLQGQAWG